MVRIAACRTGGKIHDLSGPASAFGTDYHPEEMFDIAKKLYQASR